MNIGNITSDNFNLDGNGKDIQIEVYEQLIEKLQQENQELKLELSGYRQAILEDKDMLGLKEENTELKKQLEEYKLITIDYQELEARNQELKKKYENAVADYENTMVEKEQLNSLVNSCQEEIRQLKKQVENYKKLGFKYLQDKNNNLEIQQKEFMEHMTKTIEELECDDVGDEEMKGYLIQRTDTFKEILKKYKSIIGVSDDKTN